MRIKPYSVEVGMAVLIMQGIAERNVYTTYLRTHFALILSARSVRQPGCTDLGSVDGLRDDEQCGGRIGRSATGMAEAPARRAAAGGTASPVQLAHLGRARLHRVVVQQPAIVDHVTLLQVVVMVMVVMVVMIDRIHFRLSKKGKQ